MKYIFDFDDTLLDTRKLKEAIFSVLEKNGVSRETSLERYLGHRASKKPFNLKFFLNSVLAWETEDSSRAEKLYEDIMAECPKFLNQKMLEAIQRIGPENCYIVTEGEEEFQMDKIARSGLYPKYFPRERIKITDRDKSEDVASICEANKSESVIFIDDKRRHFTKIDRERCNNLTTIPYDELHPVFLTNEGTSAEIKRK